MSLARAVPVLMYHHVSPSPGLVTVSPQRFAQQMEHVARAGFSTPGADAFVGFLRGDNTLPAKSVLITFDDGYLDNYLYAYPVLKRLRLKAVIFAVTGWVSDGPPRPLSGNGRPESPDHRACKAMIAQGRSDEVMLRWSEIQAMETDGVIEVHSHTHAHLRWDRLHPDPAERLAALTRDLRRSRDLLGQRLGKASRHLCWPWGYTAPGYRDAAESLGFSAQYLVERGTNARGSDPGSIKRLAVKDLGSRWLARQLWVYRRPRMAALYLRIRGRR